MKSNYRLIGEFIQEVENNRNTDLKVTKLLGLSMTKEFRETTSNIVGTDLSVYKVMQKWQFACDFMSPIRVYKLPVVLKMDDDPNIVSPAYPVFEVKDRNELDPEYLMMWFRRPEFDRYATFKCDSAIRGGYDWEELCNTELPVPHIDKQREIVSEYNTILCRIDLNNRLIQKLEETAQAIYKQWFVEFEFPNENGEPYKSACGEMEFNKVLEREIPTKWDVTTLEKISILITKGTTPEIMYSEYKHGLVSYIKGESISDTHCIEQTKLSFIDQYTNLQLKRSILQENDILLTIAGTLGKFAKVSKKILPANTNQAVSLIRVNTEITSPNFIFWLFIGGWQKMFFATNVQQAVQANLSLTTVGSLPILLPDDLTMHKLIVLVNPLIDIYENKLLEIQKLESLKELLLSKLATVEN